MKFIRKHKELFLLLTLGFFFMSLFVGVGSMIFTGSDTRDLAAKVGPSRVERKSFNINYRQALEAVRAGKVQRDLTPELELALQNDVLRELIIRELFAVESAKWGLSVSDREIAEDIAFRQTFQREGRFDPNLYAQFVYRTLGVLPKDFEAERRKEIANAKLRGLISWSFPPSPQELEWLYHIAKPTSTAANFLKEREEFARQEQSEAAIATLNQYLSQLSQKYPIRTFLDQQRAGQ
ncbi:MAG: SurA N-terminal domain-containing protein [Elusimicrobiota bacterium]